MGKAIHVAITGGTGFVGTRLVPMLRNAGHQVTVLARSAERARTRVPAGTRVVEVDPLDPASIEVGIRDAEAIIHLAGENLLARRWNRRVMDEIHASRAAGTQALVTAMGALTTAPRVLLSASAIGWYGPQETNKPCVEDACNAHDFGPRDFLANVCHAWEHAARDAERLGTRVVRMRLGVVLGREGGPLAQMEPPFRLGLGGPIASGKQIVSWIHIDDLTAMFHFALQTESVKGALNVTAPNPVSNREFSRQLGRALGRPAFLRTPGLALRVLFGRVAQVMVAGQYVPPTKALAEGFTFRYATLEAALKAEYG